MKEIITISILFIIIFRNGYSSSSLDICDGADDRIPYLDMRIGRTVKTIDSKYGCTATLIGPNCMITAGHCRKTLGLVEFNVPNSVNGKIKHPAPQYIYNIDKSSILYNINGTSRDWALFNVETDPLLQQSPGEVYGHYDIEFNKELAPKEMLRMSGYGYSKDLDLNFTLQSSTGEFVSNLNNYFTHRIDSEGGNSGSAIILESSQKIIGIHTHGGCFLGDRKGNHGTMIYKNSKLQRAIASCLQNGRKK